jgi:hypothetical protein
VQVAVLAGIGVESPRGSFSGPTGFAAPPSPRAGSASALAGSLLTAPAGAAAAGLMAGAVAASGGSFSMFAPPGTPGR